MKAIMKYFNFFYQVEQAWKDSVEILVLEEMLAHQVKRVIGAYPLKAPQVWKANQGHEVTGVKEASRDSQDLQVFNISVIKATSWGVPHLPVYKLTPPPPPRFWKQKRQFLC